MRILLISSLFSPDELGGASLYSDMVRAFSGSGHDIRVLCTFPYYPHWKQRPEDQRLALRDETWNGVPVRRIPMYVPASPTGPKRLLSDLSFLWSIVTKNYGSDWRPDVVLTASPMFSQCLAQRFLYWGRKIPRLIIVQDFVVDAALELGILKAPLLARPLKWLERWSFRSAATLTTISQPMLKKLQHVVGADRRVVLIPNWIHQSLQKEIARQRAGGRVVRTQRRLLYSGNLGVKQGLQRFLETFQQAASEWSIRIHGDGAQAAILKQALGHINGVSLCGVLPEADYVAALLETTACIVTQQTGVGMNFLPSKLLPALATGTPILAVCDKTSPLGEEVLAGGFGEVIPTGDARALSEVLSRWSRTPALLAEYSRRAIQWGERYSRDCVLIQFENELRRLLPGTEITR